MMAALVSAFDLQGHRGARGLAPENTLAAFARALSIGVTTLELDVGVSRDGVVMVTHNRRLSPAITRDAQGAWLTQPGPAQPHRPLLGGQRLREVAIRARRRLGQIWAALTRFADPTLTLESGPPSGKQIGGELRDLARGGLAAVDGSPH